jgi:hypothetical protein
MIQDRDPGDEQPGESEPDFDFNFEEALREFDLQDETNAALAKEAEAKEAEVSANPFTPEYLASLNDAKLAEFDVEAPVFSENVANASLAARLGSVCDGLLNDGELYNRFSRLFEATDLKELSVTITFSEREQQIVSQGLGILGTLSDDPEIQDKSYALHERIREAVHLAYAALPQSEIDGRTEWQMRDAQDRFAQAVGFENLEALREAVKDALDKEE